MMTATMERRLKALGADTSKVQEVGGVSVLHLDKPSKKERAALNSMGAPCVWPLESLRRFSMTMDAVSRSRKRP